MEIKKKGKKGSKNIKKESGPQIVYETEDSLYAYAVKMKNRDRLIVQHKYKIENYLDAARMFDELGEYKDSVKQAACCRELAEQAKRDEMEYFYKLAVEQKDKSKDVKGFEKAIKMLDRVKGYKDTDSLTVECKEQIVRIRRKRRGRQAVKLAVIVAVVAVGIWFMQTPAWGEAKQQMLEWNRIMALEMPD